MIVFFVMLIKWKMFVHWVNACTLPSTSDYMCACCTSFLPSCLLPTSQTSRSRFISQVISTGPIACQADIYVTPNCTEGNKRRWWPWLADDPVSLCSTRSGHRPPPPRFWPFHTMCISEQKWIQNWQLVQMWRVERWWRSGLMGGGTITIVSESK